MTTAAPPDTTQLKRTIGRGDVALLVIGSVIGSGIFLVPGGVLTQSGGSIGLAMLAWLFGGVLSLLGAWTYGELGAMQPQAGGIYLSIRDAFGRLPAFLYGWVIFFCICAGTIATLAVATANYVEQFVGLGVLGRKAVALAVVIGIAWLNVRGTRLSVVALNLTTGFKVAALAFLIVALPLVGHGLSNAGPWMPARLDPAVFTGVGLAMISVLWAYEGWQYATFVAGEIKEPQRSLPGGLAVGTMLLIGIYLLANLAYLAALGPEGVGRSSRVAAEAVEASFGRTAGQLIAIPIIVSMVSAAHSVLLTMPRGFYAMAKDGVFFHRLAEVHPRYGTPAFAVLAGSLVAGVLSLVGGFDQLLAYVVFVGWMFYGLAGASIFVFRRTRADWPRPFKTPGYPVTPAVFVLSAAAIVGNAILSQPIRQTVLGLGVVATGLVAYAFWRPQGGVSG